MIGSLTIDIIGAAILIWMILSAIIGLIEHHNELKKEHKNIINETN